MPTLHTHRVFVAFLFLGDLIQSFGYSQTLSILILSFRSGSSRHRLLGPGIALVIIESFSSNVYYNHCAYYHRHPSVVSP
jgi:hypothetical protein